MSTEQQYPNVHDIITQFLADNQNDLIRELDEDEIMFKLLPDSIEDDQLLQAIHEFSNALPTVKVMFSRAQLILGEHLYAQLSYDDLRILFFLSLISEKMGDVTINLALFIYTRYLHTYADNNMTADFYRYAFRYIPLSKSALTVLWESQKHIAAPLGNIFDDVDAYQSMLNTDSRQNTNS